jgi:hypothetical protein
MNTLERGVPASSTFQLMVEAVQVASVVSTVGLVVVSVTQVSTL